ncbi:MAG TPA: phosphoribosylglycinamide formyltransferase [Bacillota bacterium]|nr:phosphoribosylglycinamide formyltransferase [Bacillota bacterium]
MKRIGVLVSGGGSNLQALIDAIESGKLPAEIGVVISNKPEVFALERAARHQIPAMVIDHRSFASSLEFSKAILAELIASRVDLVCLAGFLRILDCCITKTFQNRMLNIHPSLLPAFGGKGMYGHHVHEAVIASGVKFSGATVHLVTPETDVGPIVLQDIVKVTDTDTPESLAAKVLEIEHRIYPQAVQLFVEDQITIEGLRIKHKH